MIGGRQSDPSPNPVPAMVADIGQQEEIPMGQVKVDRIRALNDALRKDPYHGAHGRTVMTAGVHALGPDFVIKALAAIAAFDNFSADNDPYGEGDFGKLEVDGHRLYFKIDYFDADCVYGSEDPTDPGKTTRVMTLMLVEEY